MKKVLAIITTALMVITVVPSVAFAEESIDAPSTVVVDEAEPEVEGPTETNDVTAMGDASDVEEPPAEVRGGEPPENGWYTDEESGNTYYCVEGNYMTGLFDVGDKTYYFATDSGILQKNCWIKDESNDYYVGEEGAVLKNCWLEGNKYYAGADGAIYKGKKDVAGKYYYFNSNGERVTGLVTISGSKYFFNPEMKTGIVKIGKAVYKFNSDGKAYTGKGWIDNNTRYAKGDGTVDNSVMKIGKSYYLFNENSGVKVTNKGFITQSGKTYYISSGVVTLGWKAIGKKAHFFYKSGSNLGAQAKNTTIGYLKIPAKGYLGEAYALGIKKLNKTKWTLKQAYRNSYKIRYQGRWWRQKTAEKYALKGFKKNKGNCYVMASTFYIQAKLLGYNVRQIEGKVNGRHPHSWTQIKQDGKWRVYDPNFRNETGRSGWKIYYGKKGTWRYNRYHVFQK